MAHPEMHTEAPGQQMGLDRVTWRRRITWPSQGRGCAGPRVAWGSFPKHREHLQSDHTVSVQRG